MNDHHQEDDSQQEKKPLTLSTGLAGKRSFGTSHVRQSFSHGRSKTVTVEVKKKRSFSGGVDASFEAEGRSSGASSRLTAGEQDARLRALKEALQAASLDAEQKEREEAERQALEEHVKREQSKKELAKKESSEEAASPPPSVENEPLSLEESGTGPEGPSASPEGGKGDRKRHVVVPSPRVHGSGNHGSGKLWKEGHDEEGVKKKSSRTESSALRREDVRWALGKIQIKDGIHEEDLERKRKAEGGRGPSQRFKQRKKSSSHSPSVPAQKIVRDVVIPEFIAVQELANRMSARAGDVVKALMGMGVMVTITETIDADTAELVVTELGHNSIRVRESDVEAGLKREDDLPEDLVLRAPVVTIMGHVDHGKTSLLDALRKTNVASREAGGITQHIGAYQIVLPKGQRITFIDTPGHAAFTEMRSRGAHVTDIVVLVVAADDGVKEQTIEAIDHARAAQVTLLVAINKVDKPDSNPDYVRQMLLQHGIVLESLGGDILDVEVSAKTGFNLQELEEKILLQAEVLDLKANPNRFAEGVIIEAQLEKGRGAVATVLVQRGTLKVGDIFVAGSRWGRVRALINDLGHKIESAGPSVPVEVVGFNASPAPGDDFVVVENENRARETAEFRQKRTKDERVAQFLKGNTIHQLLSRKVETDLLQELPVIIKADVQGSLEALIGGLEKLTTSEVKIRLLHGAVGAITESDITLAKASKAFVIGFNVRANPAAREIARREGIDLRYYSIIYNVIDEVKAVLSGLLSPILKEKFLGNAAVRQVFNITKVGKVAGCMVTEGVVRRGAKMRLLRDLVVIHEGTLKTLKRLKDEVKEVKEGYECGMAFENYQDIREGDVVECFSIEEIQRSL